MFYYKILQHGKQRTREELLEVFKSPHRSGAHYGSSNVSAAALKDKETYIWNEFETSCRETLVNTIYAYQINHHVESVSVEIRMADGPQSKSVEHIGKKPSGDRFLKWLGDLASSWNDTAVLSRGVRTLTLVMYDISTHLSKYDLSIAMWILREPVLVREVMKRVTEESTDEEIKSIVIEEMLKVMDGPQFFDDGGYAHSGDFVALAVALWCREKVNTEFKKTINVSNGPINTLMKETWRSINFSEFLETFAKDKSLRAKIFTLLAMYMPSLNLAFVSGGKGMSYNEDMKKKEKVAVKLAKNAVAEAAKRKPRKTE